jgi:hypothetical protein
MKFAAALAANFMKAGRSGDKTQKRKLGKGGLEVSAD